MVTNPHKEDIPDNNMAAWSKNLDPEFGGQMRGIKDNSVATTAAALPLPDIYESDFISYQISGTELRDLVYIDKEDGDVTAIGDFYNGRPLTIASATEATPIVATVTAGHHLGWIDDTADIGEKVTISGGTGMTAINGNHWIKRITSTTFGIYSDQALTTGVASNGAYDAGTATVTKPTFYDLIPSPSATPQCIKTFNGQAQIGLGDGSTDTPLVVWRQTIEKGMFDDAGGGQTEAAGIKYHYAKCDNAGNANGGIYPVSLTLSSAGSGGFSANILYSVGISIVYDGLQESNMVFATDSDASAMTIATTIIRAKGAIAAATWAAPLTWDKRITAIKIYLAESSDLSKANLGLHRLIKTIGIDSASWADNGSDSDLTYIYTPVSDAVEGGATYEEETGIAETLDPTYVNYGMNEVGGGYHWMAKAYVPSTVPKVGATDINWDRYIFRSQKFRPNMVDWSKNFVVLPETPIDMCFHNNYLYAFTENTVYRINPETLIIEDTYFGAGVSARGGCVSTEYGMFFCNKNGAYQLTNNEVIEISDPIKETAVSYGSPDSWTGTTGLATLSYGTGTKMGRIVVKHLATKNCILFIGSIASGVSASFAYYLPTKQWYPFVFAATQTTDNNSGVVAGKDGELYLSDDTDLRKICGGTGYQDFDWISKEFDLGQPSQDKQWCIIIWDGTTSAGANTLVVKYSTEPTGTQPVGGTTATSGDSLGTGNYAKTIQVYLDCAGTTKVDSLDIVARKKLGKRYNA